jgi:hypothetical protein
LLLHKKIELVKAPHHCTVSLVIIREGFSQPDEC